MNRTHNGQAALNLVTGILFTLVLIPLAVSCVLYFRPLYYADITRLSISGAYGLTDSQIRNNYDALIDYNSPFFFDELHFPDLPSSHEALIHFAEVKRIFLLLQLIGVVCLLFLIPLLVLQKRRHAFPRCLRTCALTTLLLPALVGGAIALSFDRAFVLFHQLFFRNDYWLFDPSTDPIILLLPDSFFLHCALAIVLLVLLGSLALYVSYRLLLFRSRHSQSSDKGI